MALKLYCYCRVQLDKQHLSRGVLLAVKVMTKEEQRCRLTVREKYTQASHLCCPSGHKHTSKSRWTHTSQLTRLFHSITNQNHIFTAQMLKRWFWPSRSCIKHIYFCVGAQSTPTCTFTCVVFFPFFFFVYRMSHSKAFSLQSKPGRNSHSSNRYVCVVFTHRRDADTKKDRVFLAVFGLPSKLSYHSWAVLSPTQAPGAARGWLNPCRINTKSSNGAWGGETLHTRNKI